MAISKVVSRLVISATLNINRNLRQDLNLSYSSKEFGFCGCLCSFLPCSSSGASPYSHSPAFLAVWQPRCQALNSHFLPLPTIAATSAPMVASWLASYQGFFSDFVANASAVCDDSCGTGAEPAIWWLTCPLGHYFLPAVRNLLLDWK